MLDKKGNEKVVDIEGFIREKFPHLKDVNMGLLRQLANLGPLDTLFMDGLATLSLEEKETVIRKVLEVRLEGRE